MEDSIEDKLVFWLINRKLMGHEFINFYDYAKEIGINSIDQNNMKRIEKILERCNKKIDQYMINYFEDNN